MKIHMTFLMRGFRPARVPHSRAALTAAGIAAPELAAGGCAAGVLAARAVGPADMIPPPAAKIAASASDRPVRIRTSMKSIPGHLERSGSTPGKLAEHAVPGRELMIKEVQVAGLVAVNRPMPALPGMIRARRDHAAYDG
jgi:hypothetical protein